MYNQVEINSPWLHTIGNPATDPTTSFVEFLRWMRCYNPTNKTLNNAKLLELLKDVEKGDYSTRLQQLTERTKRLATCSFSAECPWRIRVGGTRGPESMLLPAFDALGMPYIPSSTLKGVAREVAEREAEIPDSEITSEFVNRVFGTIEPKASMGIVTFLDAYPLPGQHPKDKKGGLCPDMVNSIWTWTDSQQPQYQPDPHVFLSLKQPIFVIGLRQGKECSEQILNQVKKWLLQALANGVGSRINSGYGELRPKLPEQPHRRSQLILSIPFALQGQCIHSVQQVYWQNNRAGELEPKFRNNVAEVRPIAFRSMLRYWFRVFSLGVLPAQSVRTLEARLFGGIKPKPRVGVFQVEINIPEDNFNPETQQTTYQAGVLTLRHSVSTECKPGNRKVYARLLKSLTWLMFHLGGIGQGARRPYYQRSSTPQIRGVNLEVSDLGSISPRAEVDFWRLPATPEQFKSQFDYHLQIFYKELGTISRTSIDFKNPLALGQPTSTQWTEAIDGNCRIVVVKKLFRGTFKKPYALGILHERFHDLYDPYERAIRQNSNEYNALYSEAKNLCGGVKQESVTGHYSIDRGAIPSPIWIANLQDYQVVTVFGATQNPRESYLRQLLEEADIYTELWLPPS